MRELWGICLRRPFLMALLILLAAVAGCADSDGPAAPDTNSIGVNATVKTSAQISQDEAEAVRNNAQTNWQDTFAISIQQAAEIALALYPNAEFLGLNLDFDRDALAYECIVRSQGTIYVVVISPETGTVQETRPVSNVYYITTVVIRPTFVSVKDACKRAKRFSEDCDVVEANIEEIENRPTYVIILLTRDNKYMTVYIDAESGKERKLNDNGDCEDGDNHKNKRGRGHYRHDKGHGYGHGYHCHCNCDEEAPSGIITKDSAMVIVSSMIDSSQITGAELHVKNDTTATYEIVVERDTNRYEITLDAFTGALIEITQTHGDFQNPDYTPLAVNGAVLVTLNVARTAALVEVIGSVQQWKLEYDESEMAWVYTFKIEETLTGTSRTVLVNAETGLFIKIKN